MFIDGYYSAVTIDQKTPLSVDKKTLTDNGELTELVKEEKNQKPKPKRQK